MVKEYASKSRAIQGAANSKPLVIELNMENRETLYEMTKGVNRCISDGIKKPEYTTILVKPNGKKMPKYERCSCLSFMTADGETEEYGSLYKNVPKIADMIYKEFSKK